MLAEPKLEERPFEVMKFAICVEKRVLVLSACCGINTHYLSRSLICGGLECPACKCGLARKYVGYVAVLWHGQRRLLRLTQWSARVGNDDGLFVPGRIVRVVKPKERRPLVLNGDGDSMSFQGAAVITRLQLLSVVARLHGLPGLPDGISEADAKQLVQRNGVTSIRLALARKSP